ncbi:MAG: 4'-phosphopantetheinyl transferase superfamily protein [Flavobacteriaceae bacterium]|jgi:3-oxoacyl-(acyl-carrier-protein) synthase/phosphopantetheinyl transferase/malonyl CoA-acyl carrier protein transacylase|nr:4'-phosphopantetheinyl transferase superfamily protein [Flavobacteriaceae bacterium]
MKNTDIAIVGMSCFLPGADNIGDFWDNLVKGIDSITDVPKNRIDSLYFRDEIKKIDRFCCHKGGFTSTITVNPELLEISPQEAKELDPVHLLALKLVYQALEDASVFERNRSLKKTSVIIGKENYIGANDLRLIDIIHTGEQITQALKNALPNLSDKDIEKVKEAFQKDKGADQTKTSLEKAPKSITDIIAGKLNIEGAAYTIDASCASSLIAVEHSIQELLNDRADVAIAGGIHFSQNSLCWSIFSQSGMLSQEQQIRPFSEDADGFLLGEGAGFVVLRRLEDALFDNDKIYAIIKGVGISSSGTETGKGQKKAILEAWEKANVKASDIGYIEANGIAVKKEDETELDTLYQLFKDNSNDQKVLLGTVKPNIGHTLSTSGIAGLIKTALSLYNRQIPATLHCEKPLKLIQESPFSPVRKTINWNEKETPLVAGINAFGFGGINAHAVLQASDGGNKVQPPVFEEEVIAISASSKDALLEALDKRNFSISDLKGKYRLVLFNPTSERIEKAKKLIAKDKPWRGRQDIWFSNAPLLKDNGKLVFVFPGLDPAAGAEIESVAKYFGYVIPEGITEKHLLLNTASRQYNQGEVIDNSLKKLGVIPDMNAGHSLGEWFALKSGDLTSSTTIKALLESLNFEDFQMEDIHFIAVGAGKEKITPILNKIPDLYLSNDNCPNQTLLCGTGVAKDALIKVLKSEQIFHQVLAFQSGFHSPFIKGKLHLLDEALECLDIKKHKIPIWSATTLELYPSTFQEFRELTIKHMTQTVRFRELIEKLHLEENARVFIQIGGGSLVGFIDDILKDREYAAISACVSTRNSLEQLRRVLALLFIEGRKINTSFLGLKEDTRVSSPEMEFPVDSSLVKTFPLLKELSKKQVETPTESKSLDSLFIKSNHPVIQAMNDNMKELIFMQKEFSEIVQKKKTFADTTFSSYTFNNGTAPNQPYEPYPQSFSVPEDEKPVTRKGLSFEEPLYIDVEDHPYLKDHSLIQQPEHWTILEDMRPVVPMTMTFELLVEAAHRQDLSKKVIQAGPVSVFQWMPVHVPFHKKIEGRWISEDKILVKIKSFASSEVILGDSYPEPLPEHLQELDLGESVLEPPTREIIYKDKLFHGPSYHGIIEIKEITQKGLRCFVKKAAGKGSLLDNIGQVFGLYLQLISGDENLHISFPVKIDEVNFYQDMQDQQGIFECICLTTSMTDKFTTADVILKREGKIWCIIKGWKNQIFEGFDKKLWNITLSPTKVLLSRIVAPNVYFFDNCYSTYLNWNFILSIYLNSEEKHHHETLQLKKRKEYLISRIAIKDAVRNYIQTNFDKGYYPVELKIRYDSNNKPSVYGVPEAQKVEISLAHKGTNSVCIASDKPVGIDIETIEERGTGFVELTFTEKELNLLKNRDLSEWSTRFWVAKEAYGKMLGTGLKGNPKQFEVEVIEGENLVIRDTTITTIKYTNFIIGWTQ